MGVAVGELVGVAVGGSCWNLNNESSSVVAAPIPLMGDATKPVMKITEPIMLPTPGLFLFLVADFDVTLGDEDEQE